MPEPTMTAEDQTVRWTYPSVGVDLEDAVRWAEGLRAKQQERSEGEVA